MEKAKRLLLGGLSLVAISLVLCAPSALARRNHASRPRVSWTLPRVVNEGQAIAFSWTGKHLGRMHRLVVQKPEGTAHTWRTIMRLHSNSGSGELAGLSLGKYRFRLADLSGQRVLAQQVAGIAVFGEVPFSTLFGGGERVHVTPTTSFPYVDSWEDGAEPAFTVEHNHCLSVHVAFVAHLGSTYGTPGVSIVTLVQESRDPVSASANFDTIGSLDANLVPGQSWAVNLSAKQEKAGLYFTYINGYAVCDSTESFFP